MSTKQLQHEPQPFGANNPDWDEAEKLLGQYEEFVKVRRVDKAYRVGTRAFFLIVNFALFLGYGLLAVQHAGETSLPAKWAYLPLMGVAICFLWWILVKTSYIVWKDIGSLETHLRRGLQHEAIRMRWYWFLDRIPLKDDTPPEEVAAALPLAFVGIHILLGVFGIAILV